MNVSKRFGSIVAVDRASFDVERGEYIVILGPSGCGKTTLLRIIAGLYDPDEGSIVIDGRDVTPLPPHKRGVSLMFQSYALFPHMNVMENIVYGLKVKKVPLNDARRKVKEIASLLGIDDLLDRYPHQLSGGQQQRVALARALVVEPKVLLLDEPLSNLDAKIRARIRHELRNLLRGLKITTIHVTHDQEEAMALADRIIVMNLGRVMQIGSPYEVYRNPRTLFIADFIGSTNFVEGIVGVDAYNRKSVRLGSTHLISQNIDEFQIGDKVVISIRYESIELYNVKPSTPHDDNVFLATVKDRIFMGAMTRVIVDVEGIEMVADIVSSQAEKLNLSIHSNIYIRIPKERIMVFRK
ncbi:MAG: ABC transporter ATP-binding protein [Ignisphaera sp.]